MDTDCVPMNLLSMLLILPVTHRLRHLPLVVYVCYFNGDSIVGNTFLPRFVGPPRKLAEGWRSAQVQHPDILRARRARYRSMQRHP